MFTDTLRRRLPLGLVILFCATGYTECEYFTTVTVPASDSTPPTFHAATWRAGEYLHVGPTGQLHATVPDDTALIVIGAARDPGGVKRIRVTFEELAYCCSGPLCLPFPLVRVYHYEDSQSGGTGARVSNGIYGRSVFVPDIIVERCASAGADPAVSAASIRWQTEAWDFKDNKSTSPWSSLSYAP